MAKSFPSRKLDKFILRLPDGMRDAIAASAKANNRSMNAEIVARLQKSFDVATRRFLPAGDDDDDSLPGGLVSIPNHLRDIANRLERTGTQTGEKSSRRHRKGV